MKKMCLSLYKLMNSTLGTGSVRRTRKKFGRNFLDNLARVLTCLMNQPSGKPCVLGDLLPAGAKQNTHTHRHRALIRIPLPVCPNPIERELNSYAKKKITCFLMCEDTHRLNLCVNCYIDAFVLSIHLTAVENHCIV